MDEQTGFIVNGSELLQTKDAGSTWHIKQSMARGTEVRFKGSTGFVVGDYGTVYQTEDLGESWRKLTVSTTEDLNSVHVLDQDTIFVTGSKSLITTTDGGSTWTEKAISPPQADPYFPNAYTITKSYFINSKVGHATCSNGTILKTVDGGQSWYATESTNTTPSSYFTIQFVNSKVGYASKMHTTLMKTTDGGETWSALSTLRQIASSTFAMHFLSEQVGFVAGEYGAMYKTSDGGQNWTKMSFQSGFVDGTSIYGIHFTDEQVGYATGMGGRIVKTTDGGQTWTHQAFTHNDIRDLVFPTSTTGYAASGELYKTTDKGQSWQKVNTGLDESYHAYRSAQFFSADTGYVVAQTGTSSRDVLIKTTDGGNTWTKVDVHMYVQQFSGVYFLNNRVGYMSTSDRHYGYGFLKTTDGGQTWQQVSDFYGAGSLHFMDINKGFAIRNGDLYSTSDGGVSWTKIYEVEGSFAGFSFVNDMVGYVAAQYGVLLKTIDGGSTWEKLAAPYDRYRVVRFYSQNTGYLIGEYGNTLRTLDGGYSWEKVELPSLITKLVITDALDMFVSGAHGRILKATFDNPAYALKVLPATKISADGAELTAVAALNSGTLTNIRLEYGKYGLFDKSIALTPGQVPAHAAEKYTYTLEDLEATTTYYYRIRATHNGIERVSDVAEFKTFAAFEYTLGSIFDLGTTGGEIMASVTSHLDEITAIQFEYATDQSFTNSTSVAASPAVVQAKTSSVVTAALRPLMPGTRYFVRLKFTQNGKVHHSAAFGFFTRPDYVITLQTPFVTKADVQWGARVETYDGDISNLVFEYGTTRDFGKQVAATPDAVAHNTWRHIQVSLTDLDLDTVYYYRVRGVQGESVIHSSVHLFRASGGALLEPDQAVVAGNSVILSGFVAPQGVAITNLQIEYGETEALGHTVAATPNALMTGTGRVQAEIKDLAPGRVYYYRIKGTVNRVELHSQMASFATAAPTGISDAADQKLKVYPNPTRDRLYFSHQYPIQRIEVLDPAGRLVLVVEPDAAQYVLDLTRQVPGIYHIRVHHKDYVHVRKVVKL